MNGWDSKEGIRYVKSANQKLDRRANDDESSISSDSDLPEDYFKNLLPYPGAGKIYKMVSWM